MLVSEQMWLVIFALVALCHDSVIAASLETAILPASRSAHVQKNGIRLDNPKAHTRVIRTGRQLHDIDSFTTTTKLSSKISLLRRSTLSKRGPYTEQTNVEVAVLKMFIADWNHRNKAIQHAKITAKGATLDNVNRDLQRWFDEAVNQPELRSLETLAGVAEQSHDKGRARAAWLKSEGHTRDAERLLKAVDQAW